MSGLVALGSFVGSPYDAQQKGLHLNPPWVSVNFFRPKKSRSFGVFLEGL